MYVGIVDEATTRELRRRVLRPTLTNADPLPGDDVAQAVHIAVLDDDETVLCTCFIYPDPCPWQPGRTAWHLRQMATRPERRGEGHGARVVEAAVRHTRDAVAEILWCNARETAVGFYLRNGFTVHGEVFTDERHTIPHRRMWRELSHLSTSSM